ncbi:hypothetical protein ABIQ69_15500 [Agromyces sp. G08B096]|uniref:ANTAR domain-containing protein n=1 Tax=Agromyces sp. G08B096 TaxID=3156399 RepID=A0AAU7W748_9MICO
MHKPSPAPHLVQTSTACPCAERTARPEYAVVALHDDLLKLAHDMHERADELGRLTTDACLLVVAAGNTVAAADLVASGRWDIDAGIAWLDSGRAAIERTRR